MVEQPRTGGSRPWPPPPEAPPVVESGGAPALPPSLEAPPVVAPGSASSSPALVLHATTFMKRVRVSSWRIEFSGGVGRPLDHRPFSVSRGSKQGWSSGTRPPRSEAPEQTTAGGASIVDGVGVVEACRPMASPERSRLLRPRFDLGVRNCAPRWAPLFSRDGLSDDIKRGGWLAANTLPLSILLASLAGAPASAGIFSAIVGSAMCVFLGGTRVALSGPGLASALVASSILTRYGVDGLGASLVLAGLLQLLTGALGVGRFVRFVPLPVLRGCVIGVGLTILLGQLPHALGAQVEPGAGPLAHFDAVALKLEDIVPEVASLCIGAALLGWLALKIRFVPGALLALVLVAVANSMLGLGLPTVHEAPSFPWPRAPLLPMSELAPLFGSALELWGTMTIATAINTVTLERLHADAGAEAKTDPDQELIGNGLATLVLGFLQGLPATQLVARSNLGVRQKVASPRPALSQALFLLVFGLAAWPLLPFVPVAALTGVAVVVAIPLLTIRPLWALGRVSGLDLWLALATIVTMLVTGTVTGLLLGIAVAFAVVAIKMARTRALLHRSSDPSGPHQVNFSGPITFLASLELERLRAVLTHLDPRPALVLDLRNVVAVDGTGASALVELLDLWRG